MGRFLIKNRLHRRKERCILQSVMRYTEYRNGQDDRVDEPPVGDARALGGCLLSPQETYRVAGGRLEIRIKKKKRKEEE